MGLPERLAGFASPRATVAVVALTYALLTPVSFLNFGRLLPVAVPLLAISIHLLLRAPKGGRRFIVPTCVLLVLAWFAVSNVWSADVRNSLLDTVLLFVVSAVALIVASNASFRDVLVGVVVGGVGLLALSLALAVVAPGMALEVGYQQGALRGITLHRNALAAALIPPVVAALSLDFPGRRPGLVRAAVLIALIVGILLTRSSTALAVTVAVLGVALLVAIIRSMPRRYRGIPLAGGAIVGLVIASAVLADTGVVLRLLGRESTLTGRVDIWEAVQHLIDLRPAIGYGWGGAWGEGSPVRQQVIYGVGFELPEAHSGYLDAILQVGYVGAALLLLTFAVILVRGVAFLFNSESRLVIWAPGLIVALLLSDITESTSVRPPMLFLVMMSVVLLVRVSRGEALDGPATAGSSAGPLRVVPPDHVRPRQAHG